MGFFGKLFEKKECAICGGEIGLLGNRKLEDGNMCKDCAKKLSPWFDDRRHSTVEQINAQLNSREENRAQLESFRHSKVLGDYYKVFIEMNNGVPSRFVVSTSDDYKEENEDILQFSQISNCTPDIRESRTELKQKNADGESVSYNPPRYEYHYDFYIKLEIQGCAYIDDMRFRLNSSTVELETVMPSGSMFSSKQSFDPMLYPEYRQYKAMVDELCEIISCGQRGVTYGVAQAAGADPVATMLQQIRNANDMNTATQLVSNLAAMTVNHPNKAEIQNQAASAMSEAQIRIGYQAGGMTPPAPQAAPAAPASWTCDACGTENTGKFCEGCGAPKPAPASARPAGAQWTCFCGAVNTGKFCNECGTAQFSIDDIECSECSWTAEPGDRVTAFCPNCGHKFGSEDIC